MLDGWNMRGWRERPARGDGKLDGALGGGCNESEKNVGELLFQRVTIEVENGAPRFLTGSGATWRSSPDFLG